MEEIGPGNRSELAGSEIYLKCSGGVIGAFFINFNDGRNGARKNYKWVCGETRLLLCTKETILCSVL